MFLYKPATVTWRFALVIRLDRIHFWKNTFGELHSIQQPKGSGRFYWHPFDFPCIGDWLDKPQPACHNRLYRILNRRNLFAGSPPEKPHTAEEHERNR